MNVNEISDLAAQQGLKILTVEGNVTGSSLVTFVLDLPGTMFHPNARGAPRNPHWFACEPLVRFST